MNINLHGIEVPVRPGGPNLFALPDLAIPAGQRVLIQGESGRGKTTLLHLIAGLFLPARGLVTLGDTRLNSLGDEQRCQFRRQNIALVFQKLNLLEHLTALENVLLGIGFSAAARAKGLEALQAVGLKSAARQRSATLSLGEQQRVAVARVLVSRSSVVLADEPTSSLDDKNAERVMDLLLQATRDRTFVVVSHDQRLHEHFDRRLQFADLVKP